VPESAQQTWTLELEAAVSEAALGQGFDLAGVAGAEAASAGDKSFTAWVQAGRAGEMEYLKRRDAEGMLLRSGLRVALPWARSIIVCALNYNAAAPRSIDAVRKSEGWIGRYAWSGRRPEPEPGDKGLEADPGKRFAAGQLLPTGYHHELLARLRVVEARLREGCSSAVETRCYVDTGPIVEREFAAKAGVGWIGKNTCVINQQLGSWLLLGVIVTSLPLSEGESPAPVMVPDRCGSCTRCIDACPTQALVAPREMDASRCIAYLTIEKKGAIDPGLREGMGRQVFGCDICQDVCPWNRKAPVSVVPGMEARAELVNPSLEWLAGMDSAAFKRWFRGSPLERTGRKRLHRNVAIAMGNSGDAGFLGRLEAWAAGEDAVLAEAADWAMKRIRGAGVSASIGTSIGSSEMRANSQKSIPD
jgi:epoxyqueuosine reductase